MPGTRPTGRGPATREAPRRHELRTGRCRTPPRRSDLQAWGVGRPRAQPRPRRVPTVAAEKRSLRRSRSFAPRYVRIAQVVNSNEHKRAFSSYPARVRQAERLSAILERLSREGAVDVADLATRLGVSAATARRDLQLLEDQRMLSRTHGGAVPRDLLYELPLRYKAARYQEEKKR